MLHNLNYEANNTGFSPTWLPFVRACLRLSEHCAKKKNTLCQHVCRMYRLKAGAVQVWHVDTWRKPPPDEGPTSPQHLCALPTHTSESRKCQINTFKNSSCSPFEIDICWKKVSTSSSSVSMSLIFLAIMDNLPHPRVHLAESDHKSNSKLCSCILKTVQTTCTSMTCYTFKHCATLPIIQKLCEL